MTIADQLMRDCEHTDGELVTVNRELLMRFIRIHRAQEYARAKLREHDKHPRKSSRLHGDCDG